MQAGYFPQSSSASGMAYTCRKQMTERRKVSDSGKREVAEGSTEVGGWGWDRLFGKALGQRTKVEREGQERCFGDQLKTRPSCFGVEKHERDKETSVLIFRVFFRLSSVRRF